MTVELQLSSDGRTLTILAFGGIDHRAWTQFQQIGKAPFDRIRELVVDLKCTDRLDGIALGLLKYLFRQALEAKRVFSIINASPAIYAILDIAGLPHVENAATDESPYSQLG